MIAEMLRLEEIQNLKRKIAFSMEQHMSVI